MFRHGYASIDPPEGRHWFTTSKFGVVSLTIFGAVFIVALISPRDGKSRQEVAEGGGYGQGFRQYIHPSLPGADVVSQRFVNLSHHDQMLKAGITHFFHISDTHFDPFFDPTETMGAAICHSCKFSTEVHGDKVYCPTTIPIDEAHLESSKYAFGRYGCNPPYRLIQSLYAAMKQIDPQPKYVVLTGDIAPHGYPGDLAEVSKRTKFADLCPTKFLIMRKWARAWRKAFPATKLIFTLGNNDHFPKNRYWQPFITALGDMLLEEGLFNEKEHKMFTTYGSVYYDVDNIRFLALDFTLFIPNGEIAFVDKRELKGLGRKKTEALLYPVRHRTLAWLAEVLAEADAAGKVVYLIGHQPMTTKKGKDELDVEGVHYSRLQQLLSKHHPIIKLGLFGHRNLAAIQAIIDAVGRPIIPSLTAPGVSPRQRNLPSFNLIFHQEDGTVVDFEQWVFDLGLENVKAYHNDSYTGEWRMHHRDLYSWSAFSQGQLFTATSLMHTMKDIVNDERLFFAIQLWKKAGYIGEETPENYECNAMYDTNADMMRCLFRNQDERCWDDAWLK